MKFLLALTATTKRITHFTLDYKKATVEIHACPASILGWLISQFISNNETYIKVSQNLFILEEWDFFGRSKTYIPVRNVTAVFLREKFRTMLVILAILCFVASIALIKIGYTTETIETIKIILFSLGFIFIAAGIFLKKRVLVSIYRGSLVNSLKFRATPEEFEKLREAMEMVMMLSTGGYVSTKEKKDNPKEKKDKEKKDKK